MLSRSFFVLNSIPKKDFLVLAASESPRRDRGIPTCAVKPYLDLLSATPKAETHEVVAAPCVPALRSPAGQLAGPALGGASPASFDPLLDAGRDAGMAKRWMLRFVRDSKQRTVRQFRSVNL